MSCRAHQPLNRDARVKIALPALLLSDGRPGHFNLAEGILAAAGRLRPIAITRIDVRRGRWPGAIVAAWSNSGLAPARLLQTVYGLDAAALPPASLVVSAGAVTLGANIACARLHGASNIFYGSLRRFRPESLDLTLTSYPTLVGRPRHAFALKPSPAASAAWTARQRGRQAPPQQIALLIGGPSGESTYTDTDWDRLFSLIATTAGEGIRWLVSNSRRTPEPISDRLRDLARNTGSPIAQFIDVRQPDAMPLAAILAAADAVLVTDESSSMVSDAIAAGLPVLGIAPQQHALTANERDYRAHLSREGWYRALPLATLTSQAVLAALTQLTPLTADPAAALSALLAERLPQLFGSQTLLSLQPATQPSRPA
jgi:uncharacterized protein